MPSIVNYTSNMLILLIVCLAVAFYFLFRPKRKGIPTDELINKLNVSPAVKAVRLKEFNKQTAKIFTKAWVLEYWRGERSPWYAWWTWMFLGRLLVAVVFFLLTIYVLGVNIHNDIKLALPFEIAFAIYTLLCSVILWRCSKNALSWQRTLMSKGLAIYFVVRFFLI